MKRILPLLINLLLIVTIISTALAYLGNLFWIFDLFSHFKFYYLLSFLFIFIYSLIEKKKYGIIVSLVFFLVIVSEFIPFYIPKQKSTQYDLSVFMANVKTENRSFSKVKERIKEVNPDVIILIEVDKAWINSVSELNEIYTFQISEARDDNFGIILMSKYKLSDSSIEYFGFGKRPSVVATVQLNNSAVKIIGTHPVPPFNKQNAAERDDQLKELGDYINKQSEPVLLVGDLNTTPFSYSFKTLSKKAELQNCFNGFGYQPTWQYRPFMPSFRLALDNCLFTSGITIADSNSLKEVGSDHLPIFVTLKIND